MPEQLSNYTCPNCGGPLHFDADSQKLKCDYCDSMFTQQEAASYFKEKEQAAAETGIHAQWDETAAAWAGVDGNMRAYNCPQCGAQLIADENTAVTTCPYCNNPTVVAHQFVAKKPKYVMPFQINKEKAIQALNAYYSGKPLLPDRFKDQNHIKEVKGVYVPYWLYSGTMHADVIYHGEHVRQYSTGRQMVTETDHFRITRKGEVLFENLPVDASKKMPDEYMDALEPFDYSKLKNFDSMYMAGYMADSYDVSADENMERSDTRMKNTTIDEMRATVSGFSAVTPVNSTIRRVWGNADYAFLPVWLLSTQWNDKNYLFAVNGQTGKVVGELPVDNGKYWKRFLITMVITAALISGAMIMMWRG